MQINSFSYTIKDWIYYIDLVSSSHNGVYTFMTYNTRTLIADHPGVDYCFSDCFFLLCNEVHNKCIVL